MVSYFFYGIVSKSGIGYNDFDGREGIEDPDNQVEAEQTPGTDSWLSRAQDLKTCSGQKKGSWFMNDHIIYNANLYLLLIL